MDNRLIALAAVAACLALLASSAPRPAGNAAYSLDDGSYRANLHAARAPITASSARTARPADLHADMQTVGVLRYFYALAASDSGLGRALSGQNIGTAGFGSAAKAYGELFGRLERQTGRVPAIVGVVYAGEIPVANYSEVNGVLATHWNSGGLVTASLEIGNPWTGGGARGRGTGGFSHGDLFAAGTEPNARFRSQLGAIADGLAGLAGSGVVVLLRPFHEANGGDFWWSAGSGKNGFASQEEFRRLWAYAFDFFTRERGLHNLLWVYSPIARQDNSTLPVDYYYPGDGYADIVGLDYYSDSLDGVGAAGFDELAGLGKPAGLAEVGPAHSPLAPAGGGFDCAALAGALGQRFPRVAFFMFWHDWTTVFGTNKLSMAENLNASGLLSDPWTINRGEAGWKPRD